MRTLLLWGPRVLGVLVALFLGIFALDAVEEGPLAFLVHLAPTLLLLLVVALSWRWEWIGGAVFCAVALAYAISVWPRADWILIISGPLAVVGVLFLWSWCQHVELHARG